MKRLVLIGSIVALTACGSHDTAKVAPVGTATPKTTAPSTGPPYRPVIVPSRFTATVTNPLFPLKPGTTLVYTGTKDGAPERVEMTVLRTTKTIMGVRCSVIEDVVTSNGNLVEKTTDWYAQDRGGSVWYFGEDSKDYANGVVTSTQGTWEAGVDGAQPGIIMLGRPTVGAAYRQEYRPGVAEDKAKVLTTTGTMAVPLGSYSNVLQTEDRDPLNPDKIETKWYGGNVGLLRARRVGSAHTEDIKLVRVVGG